MEIITSTSKSNITNDLSLPIKFIISNEYYDFYLLIIVLTDCKSVSGRQTVVLLAVSHLEFLEFLKIKLWMTKWK